MNRRDVSKLRMLQQEEPVRLSKLIRVLWPEIRAAIGRGHSLKVIGSRLEEIGISISYNALAVYVSRLRREDKSRRAGEAAARDEKYRPGAHNVREEDEVDAFPTDPLANVRDRLIHNRPGFNFDDGLPDKDKLIG
jgi:hypothetical protein